MTETRSIIPFSNTEVIGTRNSLIIKNGMSYDEWVSLGEMLDQYEDAYQWWRGDWLNYGEFAHGEMYSQALDGSQVQTWKRYKWVANKIERLRRRNLSWSHHAEVASLPEEDQDELLDLAESNEWSRSKLRQEIKKHKRNKQLTRSDDFNSERYKLIHGDFVEICEQLPEGSIDVIITDPPYPEEYLYLYKELAKVAQRVLKPGGYLLAMCGQSYLPEILEMMTPFIRYHWTIDYQTPGAHTQIWGRKVMTGWKPVLWFVKGDDVDEWHYDVVRSDRPDKDKHHWGQSESGMADIVEHFSNALEWVLDPFCGAGTTGVVALQLGRRFIGIDIDNDALQVTAGRLAEIGNRQ